ncbi:MAG: SDR family NAD(P)-dependent oxidoreductase [Bacteroidales bacterium]|nr:SDR family NAD(P)-dependent oxidoreductase [Bacteroidales bacterium]
MNHHQKNAIVTGAYGAIGRAIAEGIAAKGFRVTLVGRDLTQLENARATIIQRTSNPEIFIEAVDLGLHHEILEFSRRFEQPLHLLVNNAATAPRKRTETAEGIEVQWATNVLGYFWMIKYLQQLMEGSPGARIVNVASYWARGLNLGDPEFESRSYDNDAAYRQAKQADRMLSVAFAERLHSKGITVNSCHPGDVNSKLSNAFGFGGSESPEQGAETPLFLSLSEEVNSITGKYYEHLRPVVCPFSRDQKAVEQLFDLCDQTG